MTGAQPWLDAVGWCEDEGRLGPWAEHDGLPTAGVRRLFRDLEIDHLRPIVAHAVEELPKGLDASASTRIARRVAFMAAAALASMN